VIVGDIEKLGSGEELGAREGFVESKYNVEGIKLGLELGMRLGLLEGFELGLTLTLGLLEGFRLGLSLGSVEGFIVGSPEG